VKANRSLRDALREQLDYAASAVLNARGEAVGCRPLMWAVPVHEAWIQVGVSGLASSGYYADADALAVISQWAAAFDLTPVEQPIRGTRAYQGEFEDVHVEVWAITDRDEFEKPSPNDLTPRSTHG